MEQGEKGWLKRWREARAIRVNLRDAFGEDIPDFFVLLKDPATQTSAELREDLEIPAWTPEDFEKAPLSRKEEMIKTWQQFLGSKIIGWNLTDPDTGEPLPLPNEGRATEVFARLPAEFLTVIGAKLREAYERLPAGPR